MERKTKTITPFGLSKTSPFFYIIRHIKSEKLYAGYCSAKKHCNSDEFMTKNGYNTSSKIIKKLILDDGVDSFIVDRITHFSTGTEACEYETRFLCKVNAKKNGKFFNKSNGKLGYRTIGGRLGHRHSEKTKQKIRESRIGKCGYKHTKEARKKMSDCNKDKPKSKETKTKLSNAHKGKILTEYHKEKISKNSAKANLGCHWWNNGEDNFFGKMPPDETYTQGMLSERTNSNIRYWNNGIINKMSNTSPGKEWNLGMISDGHMNNGKKWWTNGLISKFTEYCPGDGWIGGRIYKRKSKQVNFPSNV
jgi:hypothetical protein